ncbi:hypothetical protein LSH36_462g02045 [Paralvinella palmiformis]|uniref:Uncharacterized protein n=1 Tax=Paralvinella palmiformis TaxID=53620 RepID=A0AAD9MZ96_9ANNE|nr:hypothetical protein LSH36_462g02045 [Paralvinella palmiformis]
MARYPSIVTVVVVLALVRLGCGRDNRAPINMLGVIFDKSDPEFVFTWSPKLIKDGEDVVLNFEITPKTAKIHNYIWKAKGIPAGGEFIIQAKVTNQRGDVLLCLKGTVYTKSSDDYSYHYDDYSYYF